MDYNNPNDNWKYVFLLTFSQRSEKQMILFSDLCAACVVDDKYAD